MPSTAKKHDEQPQAKKAKLAICLPLDASMDLLSTTLEHQIAQLPRAGLEEALKALLNNGETAPKASQAVQDSYQHHVLRLGLDKKDIWMQIFSFVGPGHFLYVALVSRRFKELYLEYFYDTFYSNDEIRLKVMDDPSHRHISPNPSLRRARGNDTFYRAAFSSVACADYWSKDRKGQNRQRLASFNVTMAVARHGNLDVLKWAKPYGWDCMTCLAAAKNGQLMVLKHLHENGVALNSETCDAAAMYGHLECLRYAHEKGCDWDHHTCEYAAGNGHLDCLRYAHEKGCKWRESTCTEAAQNGHLECLKYAHEEGCEWRDLDMCSDAAGNGHLDCLEYLHNNGCEWDVDTCYWAAEKGHLECLQYARANGCDWNASTYLVARAYRHEEVAEWAKNNGCPTEEEG